MSRTLFTATLFVLCLTLVHADIYVIMKEGERRCLFEEVPARTLIRSSFQSSPAPGTNLLGSTANEVKSGFGALNVQPVLNSAFEQKNFGIRVTVYYPESVEIYSEELPKSAVFTFTSGEGGEYKFCFQTTTSSWFGDFHFKFNFALDTGADAVDYKNVARKEHLSTLELEVRRLIDRTKGVLGELQYQKEREVSFRNTSESTNSRAAWFSVMQLAIILVSGFIQMQYLRQFFARKKLI